jgi:uncharacterized protein YjbJ (UPF0337 family)
MKKSVEDKIKESTGKAREEISLKLARAIRKEAVARSTLEEYCGTDEQKKGKLERRLNKHKAKVSALVWALRETLDRVQGDSLQLIEDR